MSNKYLIAKNYLHVYRIEEKTWEIIFDVKYKQTSKNSKWNYHIRKCVYCFL